MGQTAMFLRNTPEAAWQFYRTTSDQDEVVQFLDLNATTNYAEELYHAIDLP